MRLIVICRIGANVCPQSKVVWMTVGVFTAACTLQLEKTQAHIIREKARTQLGIASEDLLTKVTRLHFRFT